MRLILTLALAASVAIMVGIVTLATHSTAPPPWGMNR